jgi:tetraacyldisaccharide 4'-kinase
VGMRLTLGATARGHRTDGTQMIERWGKLVRQESVGIVTDVMRALLFLMSQFYRLAMTTRNYLYDRGWKKINRVEIPVISVGNLTVGGTGKSPTVALLAKWFRERNFRVAIISRGYGAGRDGVNDEAKEIEKRLPDVPHLQNPNRYAAAKVAQEELDMQVLIMDDGFQHRRLHRDLEIVLLDATQPFGLGYMLPRGMLRESIRSLRRADVVVLTRSDLVTRQQVADTRLTVQRFAPRATWVEANHQATTLINASGTLKPTESLVGKKVLAFCGIGNPEAFFETARKCGAEVVNSIAFPDHHAYVSADIERILATSPTRPELFLCTGKDLAKLEVDQIGNVPLWALQIDLRCSLGADALDDQLRRVVDKITLDAADGAD